MERSSRADGPAGIAFTALPARRGSRRPRPEQGRPRRSPTMICAGRRVASPFRRYRDRRALSLCAGRCNPSPRRGTLPPSVDCFYCRPPMDVQMEPSWGGRPPNRVSGLTASASITWDPRDKARGTARWLKGAQSSVQRGRGRDRRRAYISDCERTDLGLQWWVNSWRVGLDCAVCGEDLSRVPRSAWTVEHSRGQAHPLHLRCRARIVAELQRRRVASLGHPQKEASC
jgi:hypothetical protein